MRDVFTRASLRRWAWPVAAAAAAVTLVFVAPLASPNRASAKVVISGARSLSDRVSVKFEAAPPGHTTQKVHILAFNDLHGTLDPLSQTLYGQYTGGVAFLAKKVKDLQATYGAYQATIFAGDNIGASPLASALFHDEPIQIATNLMHVDFGSVGNHEFDEGSDELLRMQNGGCHPVDGCQAAPYALAGGGTTNVYPGADFQYLAANVVVNSTGATLFPSYGIKQFTSTDGKRKYKVGFIGEVLEGTPTIVTPTGVAGLTFEDEAEAANRAVAELADKGVKIPVLVIHQGGFQTPSNSSVNGCNGSLAGSDIANIAAKLDPSIKVIVSAHTHAEYRCTITAGGVTRVITSASSFGRVLSDITLTIDENNDKLLDVSANNILITNALNPSSSPPRQPDPSKADPAVQAVVNQYVAAAKPLASKVIGSAQGDLNRTASTFGETTLGDVIADAQYVATHPANLGGADVAFMNPGGIRADLPFNSSSDGELPGQVTYNEAFTVQPFGNTLVTKTMNGDMLRRLLEQQFNAGGAQCAGSNGALGIRVLQISSSFKYESNPTAATCDGKIGKMWVNGVEVTPSSTYRVTMNNFLATGGDGFTVFNEGTDPLGGAVDLDAFVAYFGAAGTTGVAVPALNRIVAIP